MHKGLRNLNLFKPDAEFELSNSTPEELNFCLDFRSGFGADDIYGDYDKEKESVHILWEREAEEG